MLSIVRSLITPHPPRNPKCSHTLLQQVQDGASRTLLITGSHITYLTPYSPEAQSVKHWENVAFPNSRVIPETKWFGKLSLVIAALAFTKKPRRC